MCEKEWGGGSGAGRVEDEEPEGAGQWGYVICEGGDGAPECRAAAAIEVGEDR